MASVEKFPYESGVKAAELLLNLLDKNPDAKEEFNNEVLQSKLVVHMSIIENRQSLVREW